MIQRRFTHYLIILCLALINAVSSSAFQMYVLVDDLYEKSFLVRQSSKSLFLTFTCKESNVLSVVIRQDFVHEEAPRFNIYSQAEERPKMGQKIGTFLSECHIGLSLNTSNFLQIRRKGFSQPMMTINEVSFKKLANSFVLWDESVKWGMGQRFQSDFALRDGSWTLWNRDRPWKIDQGGIGNSDQTYGHQPVYLAKQRLSRLYHLTYFKNTHGLLLKASQDTDRLQFNFLGGVIHFIVVIGNQDPESLLERYHEYIGRSHIPPFWSLGFHQSRWGYRNLKSIIDVLEKYKKHDLPLDSIWSDLEYMKGKMIFTINEQTHPSQQINQMLLQFEINFIPLLDVAISIDDIEGVDLGKEMNIFFMDPYLRIQEYQGEVWPGKVYYIDYLHPNASLYWKIQMKRLSDKINFAGIWLDMNEPTNFKGGHLVAQPIKIQQFQGINTMTINVEIEHFCNSSLDPLYHREVHSYYGHLSILPTYQYLKESGRPFIITRSNSVGTGLYAGHWTGDNVASWDFLRLSINGNFLFQIFGIQMVGADICGFYQDTTEQLCSRWTQLGSFYPFARNHNHQLSDSQQPFAFGQTLLQTFKLSLRTRYALLKQLYTFMVRKKGLGTFFRPLTFEFFKDEQAYDKQTIQTQFLLGRSILVAPIVYQQYQSREVYFPGQDQEWYQFQVNTTSGAIDHHTVNVYKSSSKEIIVNILPAPPLTFLRSGYMIFTNKPENRSKKLNNSFNIFVALNNTGAVGYIMGIKDYNYEPHMNECLSHDCSYKFTLIISDDNFQLSWEYIGTQDIRDQIVINDILIAKHNQRWRNKGQHRLTSTSGKITFQK